jgi:hypothetical protein
MPGDSADQRTIARILVAALCLAAAVVVVLVLGASESDPTAGRVLGVAVAVALFSLTAAAGMRLAGRAELVTHLFGYVAVIASLIAFGETVAALWADDVFDDQWRTAAEAGLVALAAANICLLLASEHIDDAGVIRAARGAAAISVVVLTAMALIEISSPGRDVGIRPMAVFAVIYLAGGLLIPLLRRAELSED